MLRQSIFIVFLFVCISPTFSNDLNDVIGLDEPIKDHLETDINYKYIVAKSKTRAFLRIDNDLQSEGIGNINIGPNANLKGATIINSSNIKDVAIVD